MKTKLLIVLSYVTALVSSVPGLIYRAALYENKAVIIALTVVFLLPIFLFIFNLYHPKRFMEKLNNTKVAEMNAFLVSHREDAPRTAAEKLKELKRIRLLTLWYSVLLVVCAVAIANFGVVLGVISPSFPILLLGYTYSALIFFAVYSRIHREHSLDLREEAPVLDPQKFPLIYSSAGKAAERVGCNEEIVLILGLNCTARVTKDNKRVYIQLGAILLGILSEEELYSIFLHELSHFSDSRREEFYEAQYNRWLMEESQGDTRLSGILSLFYLDLTTKYSFNYRIYEYASSVINEIAADTAMAKHSDPRAAVSALLKTHYDTMYFWESCVKNEPSIYESEELKADYLRNAIASFNKAIGERSEFWNELVGNEIIANNATHPTLKMRMDALGVDELAVVDREDSPAYTAEIESILDYAEKTVYDERIKTYEKDRREQYLEPLARINAWNEGGNLISPETYADIISDLKTLGRHEEAEALCDRVISQLPGLSSAHAVFMKGAAMLYRYDENGMDLIYRAMEQNGNYIEEGVNVIGSFCCMTGRESDLVEYRKRAAQLGQKYMDNDSQISFLSKNDNLTKEELPEGMLEEILAYIKTIDGDIIENIYLVRKTVNETFFASAFIIHFYGGTDAQQSEIMHKIFRYLDSHPSDWQFALFDYFEYPDIKVEKIEGSLVYSKNKGE